MFNKEVFHQTLAIIPVAFNEFSWGVNEGWLAPTLKKLQSPDSELPLNLEECSWIGSLHEFGRGCGPFLSIFLLDKIGRKPVLIMSTIIFSLTWALVLCTKLIPIMYLIRLLVGICIGLADVTSAIYLGENCSPKLRGIFSSITLIAYSSGITTEMYLATYFSYNTVSIINLSTSFIGITSIFMIKETPHFLVMKKNYEKAESNLAWLKGSKTLNEVYNEFEDIKQHVAAEASKKSVQELFTSPINLKSLLIGMILNIFYMSSGYAAIITFATLIYVPSETHSSYDFTLYYSICQNAAAILSIFIIEQFNRRTLVLLSFSSFVILHSFTAALFYFQNELSSYQYYPWVLFFFITIYGSLFCFVYPVVHIIRGELFPQSTKVIGGCFAIAANSMTGFIWTKLFLTITVKYGIFTNFLLYAICSLTAIIYTYFNLPETRGKTLTEICDSYKK